MCVCAHVSVCVGEGGGGGCMCALHCCITHDDIMDVLLCEGLTSDDVMIVFLITCVVLDAGETAPLVRIAPQLRQALYNDILHGEPWTEHSLQVLTMCALHTAHCTQLLT